MMPGHEGSRYALNLTGRRRGIADETLTLEAWQAATGDNSIFERFDFPDPQRSIETYQTHIGGTATIDAFIQACRHQDRYHWDARYTAGEVNDWIRAGFGLEEIGGRDYVPGGPDESAANNGGTASGGSGGCFIAASSGS